MIQWYVEITQAVFCNGGMLQNRLLRVKLFPEMNDVWKSPRMCFCNDGWLVVLRLNVPVNNFSVMSGRFVMMQCYKTVF